MLLKESQMSSSLPTYSKSLPPSHESTPDIDATPMASVLPTTPKRIRTKHEDKDKEESPVEGVVTREMVKEESDLYETSQQKELADLPQQVL